MPWRAEKSDRRKTAWYTGVSSVDETVALMKVESREDTEKSNQRSVVGFAVGAGREMWAVW